MYKLHHPSIRFFSMSMPAYCRVPYSLLQYAPRSKYLIYRTVDVSTGCGEWATGWSDAMRCGVISLFCATDSAMGVDSVTYHWLSAYHRKLEKCINKHRVASHFVDTHNLLCKASSRKRNVHIIKFRTSYLYEVSSLLLIFLHRRIPFQFLRRRSIERIDSSSSSFDSSPSSQSE